MIPVDEKMRVLLLRMKGHFSCPVDDLNFVSFKLDKDLLHHKDKG
jgi:hypothetical protein